MILLLFTLNEAFCKSFFADLKKKHLSEVKVEMFLTVYNFNIHKVGKENHFKITLFFYFFLPDATIYPKMDESTELSSPETTLKTASTSATVISEESGKYELPNGFKVPYGRWASINKVKPGYLGDAQFTKNLATALWGEELLNRSLTGTRCKSKSNSMETTPLTPEKIDTVVAALRNRITSQEDVPEKMLTERLSHVPRFLTEKIQSMNRLLKKKKIKNLHSPEPDERK